MIGAGLAAAGLLATYLLYPAVLVAWRRVRSSQPTQSFPEKLPTLSFIVIAHNEAESIRAKLENTLSLDWPADRFELIVASDASTDGTDEIVKECADRRVRLVRNPERGGKTATTRFAVEVSRGEVLVFSDATGIYTRGALRALVAPFADPTVGAVSGRVVYRYDDSENARGFRLYQRWVVAQRRSEADLGTVTSVSGAIHALRREVFEVVPGHLSYDMVVPALTAMCGLRSVYASDATALEVSRTQTREEFKARVRIAVRAYAFLGWLWQERHRLRDRGYLMQLCFHKILRWFSVHLLALLLICHLGLAREGGLPALLLVPHLALWATAALLAANEGRLRFPGSAALLLFATVNAAYAVGFLRWLRGTSFATWTPDRAAERAQS